jgi:hypothetical protein
MIAVMLPSYQRLDDLTQVLEKTPLRPDARFVVVANYEPDVYRALRDRYSDRAVWVNEREHGKLGGCRAYNLAYSTAIERGFDFAIHFADDVLPAEDDWLDQIDRRVIAPGHDFAIFSSDECHYGSFGWNIVRDTPIAHFYVIRCGLLGGDRLFDTRYRQYVIDLELSVQVLKSGRTIQLIPVRLRHYRSPLNREDAKVNYAYDEKVFYELNPDFEGWLSRPEARRYIPENGQSITIPSQELETLLKDWPRHVKA